MAKRFTDTNKWRKPFIRGLEAPYKLLWFYILDDCDHAGIWIVDFEVAQIRIGKGITQAEALILFKDKIDIFDNGERWFIPDFVSFQYGELNSANRAHNSVINALKKYNLPLENKPLISPLQGAKDKDKVKEKDKDKVKEKVIMPFSSDEFIKWWGYWREYKSKEHKFKYASHVSEQAALKKLSELSNGDEASALKIIEQSIAEGWKGFFEVKQQPSTDMQDYKTELQNRISNGS